MLELKNISKYYYSESSVTRALSCINLILPDTGFVAITGESGSGKSTLLNIISGLDVFDDGEMYIDGKPTFQYDEKEWEEYRRSRIGFVFQEYELISHYSVLDNMISSGLILGRDIETAREKGIDYLKQVGLDKLADHKARELSSGQKQRLSIARALAKETGIIVADEPTGNLDSETGVQIVKLLKEISKTSLVIMVTHNYDQVENLVDRKIRIHDGEIVQDLNLNHEPSQGLDLEQSPDTEQVSDIEKTPDTEQVSNKNEVVRETFLFSKEQFLSKESLFFSWKNIRTRGTKSLFFFSIFLLVAITSFVFMGEIISQRDDVFAKDYDNVIFAQENPVRVAIRRLDDKEISKEDITRLKQLSHVESVEKYDGINDINYYFQKGKDYDLDYNDMRYFQGKAICSVSFLKQDRFMKSVSSIAEEKLQQGKMAKSQNEIVVSRDCGLKMGQKIKIYFTCDNAWGAGQFFERDFKVVGVTKRSLSQIYFSNAFGKMLDATVAGYRMKLNYKYDIRKGTFIYKDQFIPLINEKLPDTQGDDYPVKQNFILAEGDGIKPEDGKADLIGEAVTSLFYRQERGGDSEDTNGVDLIQSQDQVAFLEVKGLNENMSARFIEVSKESFYHFYDSDSKQMSVFLDSYANMDSVLEKVQKLGYMGISTYRISTGDYDDEKVNNRTTRLIVAVGILLFLALLETVLISIIMGMQSDYYLILHSMGMKRKQLRKVCFVEMFLYFATSVIVVLALAFLGMWLLRALDLVGKQGAIAYVNNILYYFKWPWIIGYILYNFLLQVCATKVFVRRMRGGIRL